MSSPGDMLLLTGSAVINESMLTGESSPPLLVMMGNGMSLTDWCLGCVSGESAPVPKEALPLDGPASSGGILTSQLPAKHMLYCGTQVSECMVQEGG